MKVNEIILLNLKKENKIKRDVGESTPLHLHLYGWK